MQFWILLTAFVMVAAIRKKATFIEPRSVKVIAKSGSDLSSLGAVQRGTTQKTSTKPTFPSLSDVATIQPRRGRMKMTNPQVIRAATDCSTKFSELTRNSAFSPEKIILNSAGGMRANEFCHQQKRSSADLSTACPYESRFPDWILYEADNRVAFAASSIASMMNFVCHKSSLKVIEDRDGKCDNSVKRATIACLAKYGIDSRAVVYPSDLLIMMMKESLDQSFLCNIKNSIRSEMQKGACSAEHQETILRPLDSLVFNCPTEIITTTPIPTASKPPTTTTNKGPTTSEPPYTSTTEPTRPTDYSDRPFTDKDGRETRADTGCMEWRNVGRSLGSACDDAADYMCSQRIPPTDAANCWAVKDDSSCCKKVKVIKGRYSLSECLSDCTRDPAVCRKQYPATEAAKCSVRPSGAHGATCCVAEFIYT